MFFFLDTSLFIWMAETQRKAIRDRDRILKSIAVSSNGQTEARSQVCIWITPMGCRAQVYGLSPGALSATRCSWASRTPASTHMECCLAGQRLCCKADIESWKALHCTSTYFKILLCPPWPRMSWLLKLEKQLEKLLIMLLWSIFLLCFFTLFFSMQH